MFNSLANKFLINLVKDKPIYILASLALSLSNAIFDVIWTILLIPIAVILFGNSQEVILTVHSPIVEYLFAFCNSFNDSNRLAIVVTLSALAFVLKTVASFGTQVINIKYTKHLSYQMKAAGFSLLCQVDLDYFYQNKVSDILFKLNREIDKTALFIKNTQRLWLESINIIIFSFVLFFTSVSLTTIGFLLLLGFVLFNYYFSIYSKKQAILLSQSSKTYARIVVDFLTGIYQIKINANENEIYTAITQATKERNTLDSNAQIISALIQPLNILFKAFVTLVLLIASYYLSGYQIQEFAPIFLIHLVILFKLLTIVEESNNTRLQIINNKASVEIISNFLERANKPIAKSGKINFINLASNIEFNNVTFAYPNQARIVLDKINLCIARGETVAIAGSVGAGKSTIISLIARFYDPIEGNIFIDGKNIQKYNLASIRKNISIINGEPFLFGNSLKYNLTYGLSNISESEIMVAAKKTKLYEFITQLPQGLSTNISNDSKINISPIQKQLITITRALISNPQIVILDLSFARLAKNEREFIQEALDELCRDRTTIAITNHLATIKKADRIIILNKGKIVESGTHEQLLKNGNLYKKMCSAQFKTSQQSHQQKLAKRISKKLAHQTNNSLSVEIRNNLNSLLNYLQLVNEGSIKDEREQERILDESYQSAKNMLTSLREYEQKIARGFKKHDDTL